MLVSADKASVFCLPRKQYEKRQYFGPFDWTSRNIPLPSVSLYGAALAFAFRTCPSVRGIVGFCGYQHFLWLSLSNLG